MRKSRPTGGADPLSVDTSERRRSTQLILVMRGLRSLAYGLLAVLLGVALALVVAGLSLRLSSPVEAPLHAPVQVTSMWQRLVPPFGRSRGIVWRLTALFSVDALAGGLVVQSLMALFFHLLYVASETGVLSVFEESGQTLHKLYEGFVATEAHTIAVDEQTHRIFLPLQEVHGKPLLRIAIVCQPSHPTPDCHE